MRVMRDVQLALLEELHRACKENGIPYILSRHTARSAWLYKKLPDTIGSPTIAMHYTDAVRLMKKMQLPNRQWENAFSNRKIPRKIIRYCDTNSLYIKADEAACFSKRGIGVEIELIRKTSRIQLLNRICILLEAACDMCAILRTRSIGWKLLLAIIWPFETVLLRILYRAGIKPDGNIRIARFPKKSIVFSQKLLTDRCLVEVGGHRFFVPSDMEAYMLTEFDARWQHNGVQISDEDIFLIVEDADTPYKDAADIIKAFTSNTPRICWIHWYLLRGKIRFLRERIEGYWNLLFFTRDRFAFHRELMPRKKEICDIYQRKEYEALESIFAPYLSAIDKHYKNHLVLCFDAELFEIATDILAKCGRRVFAQKLRDKVRPEHLVPIKFEGQYYD